MLRKSLLTLTVAAFAVLPLAASAQYNGQYNNGNGDTLLPSQSVITGTLEQSINSKTSQVGDPFVLDVQAPFPADDQRYQGAKVYGHVASVTHAGGMKKGGVDLAFDRLTLVDGTTAAVQGQTLSADPQGNRANTTDQDDRRRRRRPDSRQLRRQAHRHGCRRRDRRNRRRALRCEHRPERHRAARLHGLDEDDGSGDRPFAPAGLVSQRQRRLPEQLYHAVPDAVPLCVGSPAVPAPKAFVSSAKTSNTRHRSGGASLFHPALHPTSRAPSHCAIAWSSSCRAARMSRLRRRAPHEPRWRARCLLHGRA